MNAKTSQTHPIQIAETVTLAGGVVGITFCPGKHQASAYSGAWARDLDLDLAAIRQWGASAVLTLVTAEELVELKVEEISAATARHGMVWLHLPIVDVSTPTAAWEALWQRQRNVVHDILDAGGRVLVHCKGGLGRAGTVAARILIERGHSPENAIAAVRAVRPGAIETRAQEVYVKSVDQTP
jgi:protein-tyrosine phosphatase